MKKLIALFAFTAFLFSCNKKADQPVQTNKVSIGTIDSLFSKTLNEQRKIWVHVPDGYKKSSRTKYPALYLLDGDAHFYSVAGMIHQLSSINGNTICPEMIVVAVPNTDRFRDLTPTRAKDVFGDTTRAKSSGGGENFTKFISDELIPYIDSHYPTTSYRTLIGHSLGGLMVINTLVHHTDLFANYLAIDPSMWWDKRKLLTEAKTVLNENKFNNKFLYVAIANTMREGMKVSDLDTDTTQDTEHIRAIFELSEFAKNKAKGGLPIEFKYYADDDHGSVPLIAEYDALHAMFSWYELKGFNKYFDPKTKETPAEIVKVVTDHYSKLSEHFGYPLLPPEAFVNSLGYGFMQSKMNDKALAFFNLNAGNYPESANVFDSMGDYHLAQKDTAQAIQNYEKSLSLEQTNGTKEKLKKLKK
jgi:predicted alpha/beta superfamily hydrolase